MVAVEKPTTANSPWPITMGWLHPSPLLSLTQFPITPVLTHSSLLAGYIYYLSAFSYHYYMKKFENNCIIASTHHVSA